MIIYLDSATNGGSIGAGLILWAILVALYFLPSIVAALRHHHNLIPIVLLNFFLGWTIIGWIIFIAMAFSNPAPQVYAGPNPRA